MAEDRDIVELLLAEHQEFRQVLDELEQADPQHQTDLFRYAVERLAGHEAAEEAVVHRAVRDDVPGGEDVAEAVLAEESSAEQLVADMGELEPGSPEFASALGRLKADVLAHAEHEEREEFPRIRDDLDPQRRQEMGRRFQQLRDTGPTRPHPDTPQTPEVRAMAGPVVGAFDRARDAVRNAFSG